MTSNRSRNALLISLTVSCFSLAIKLAGFILTDSNTAFSDAAESVIHVIAVGFVFYGLHLSRKPADEKHLYGHERVEFFSVGVEGTVIVLAGLTIIYQSIRHLIFGHALQQLEYGIIAMGTAGLINLGLGLYLLKVGREENNMMVVSNGKHTLTDVWTSAGVVVTLVIIRYTHWTILDSIVSMGLAGYIMFEGMRLLKYSVEGLMDTKDPKKDQKIRKVLEQKAPKSMLGYHHLRHRTTGQTTWVEFHAVFDKNISLKEAHDVATVLERHIIDAIVGDAVVTIHLEPEDADRDAHQILEGANRRPLEDFM